MHEHQDGRLGVASAHSDVVQAAVVAQGEFAVGVDLVVADAVVAIDERDAGGGRFGPGGVCLGWGASVQSSVWSDGVVVVAERVELALQFGDGGCLGLGGQPFLDGLVEASTLPQVCGR
ncbi:MAG TPA: hypothetical protein VGH11_15880 [Jatrophihabitans sp.]